MIIWPAVQVVERLSLKQACRPAANFVGGPVVKKQLPAASDDVDAALAQDDLVAIDPLMRVAHDEHIIGADGDDRPGQPESLDAQILRLVNDDCLVGTAVALVLENEPRVTHGLLGFLQTFSLSWTMYLEHRPDRFPLPTI